MVEAPMASASSVLQIETSSFRKYATIKSTGKRGKERRTGGNVGKKEWRSLKL
jgi:hypothetical protein